MPPKEKGDASSSRPTTRKRNGSLTTPDELQDIKNALDGRKFLEKFSLLCPAGEPTSIELISICLHQISLLPGLSKQATNAVRASALLLEELGENCVNETVKSAFDSQITEFTSDMKQLVEDVNIKIDIQLQAALIQITKASESAVPTPVTAERVAQTTHTYRPTNSYASALINPPTHVNPKLAAREGIRARQFVLLGIKETQYGQHDTQKLKMALNKILREVGMTEGKIRSVITQRDDNILIEVDSDHAANWCTNKVNRVEFCTVVGEGVSFRTRAFNVLAFNVPLTIDPRDPSHCAEINEVNDLEDYAVSTIRWAKPLNRRSPQQRSAHLVLTFGNPEAANRAISNGIVICHKKCHVERIKKEPIRCLKCQGWNHMARDCNEEKDKCSNCAGAHRTAACLQPRVKRCVSCKSDEHASWDRECPTFLKKVSEFNERNPENSLPFFPTADPWTWSAGDANSTNLTGSHNVQRSAPKAPTNARPSKGKSREPQAGGGTYFPDYDNPFQPYHEFSARFPPTEDWWDRNGVANPINPGDPEDPPGLSQPSNNSGIAGPSTPLPNA